MNIMCILIVFDDVDECNPQACDSICTNLVNEFNNLFNLRIAFGGNAENMDCFPPESLDDFFLTDDVVNLALMSYLDAIQDGTFFSDTELVQKYFVNTNNVKRLFRPYMEN